MDKLKQTLGPVYKHGFWVTCGVIVVLALGMWFLSTLGLRKTTKANVDQVNAAFSKAESVNNAGVDAAGDGSDPTQVRFHPNDTSAQATQRLIARLKAKVAEAWFRQYSHQRGLFVWPKKLSEKNGEKTNFQKALDKKLQAPRWQFDLNDEQIIKDVLTEKEAIDQIASERGIDPEELAGKGKFVPYQLPIEVAVAFPTKVEDEIPDSFRRIYRDFVKGHVPTLAEKIRANWNPTVSTGSGGVETASVPTSTPGVDSSSATGADVEDGADDEIVAWNGQNQGHWLDKLSAFADRAEQDFVPTTLQMLYTQEDLWVLEALLTIIQETNGDVSLKHEAAVKEIDFLLTGMAAGEMPGSITPIGQASGTDSSDGANPYGADPYSASGSEGGTDPYSSGSSGDPYSSGSSGDPYSSGSSGDPYSSGSSGDPYSSGSSGDPYSSGAEGQGQIVLDPADNRYVNRDYRMIRGSVLRNVFAEDPTPEEAYLRVAKRIPVRMGLKMDARKLAKLLAACSNSPLVLEVRQVRINRHTAADGAAGAGGESSSYGSGVGSAGGESSSYGSGVGSAGGGRVQAGSIYGGSTGSAATTSAYAGGQDSTGASSARSEGTPVEIYGVILIYNPVDAKTLEVKAGEVQEEPAENGGTATADAVPPAAT